MACLISLCSFTPPASNKTLTKDLQAQRAGSDRLLSPATRTTEIHLMAPKSAGGVILSVKRCQLHMVAYSRHFSEPVFPDYDVRCTPVVISGFWVGPDFEDGWGYVEAFVNKIF